MPVWHELTKKWRADGKLAVVGITQEQHPERCRLFAQWQRVDWPILWDPLNTTGASAVPRFTLIDEHGVVRGRADPKTIEAEFLDVEFEAPTGAQAGGAKAAPAPAAPIDGLPQLAGLDEGEPDHAYYRALSDVLWKGDLDAAIETLTARVAEREDPIATFRLGVAYRMRMDSAGARRGDFQSAVDHWTAALALRPKQYIWRRRIQQYGPRMDKPYPFYDWIDEGRAAITARGETPVAAGPTLTASELAQPRKDGAPATETANETERGVAGTLVDSGNAIEIEPVVVVDTSGKRPAARVYLGVRTRDGADDPRLVVDGGPGKPRRLGAVQRSGGGDGDGPVWFELDVELVGDEPVLTGRVLARSGTAWLSRAFSVPLSR